MLNGRSRTVHKLEFKALSQNLGHEHAMTTYNAYGDLSVDERFQVIAKIGAAHAELANVPMDAILQEICSAHIKVIMCFELVGFAAQSG